MILKSLWFSFVFLLCSISYGGEYRFFDLSNKAVTSGDQYQTVSGRYFSLSQKINYNPADYKALNFSCVGRVDDIGVITKLRHEVVSEYWFQRPNENWLIDQWLFRLDKDGLLEAAWHYKLERSKDGRLIDHYEVNESTSFKERTWKRELELLYKTHGI